MKNYLLIGIAVISLSATLYAKELIQKTDAAKGIVVDAGDDNGYDGDGDVDTFVWTGPGWYGGYWFATESDFDDWHRNNWHGGHGQGGHGHGGGAGGGGGGGGGHH